MKLAHRPHGDSILNDSVTNHPDVAAALELLKPYQATLVEAARFYIKNSNLIRDPRKLEEVKAELLQSKAQDSPCAEPMKYARPQNLYFASPSETIAPLEHYAFGS